jgi:hypothetical protein
MKNERTPQDRLTYVVQSIKRWRKLPERDKMNPIHQFMHALGNLYLEYFQSHLEEAKAIGKAHQNLLKDEFDTIYKLYVLKWSSDCIRTHWYDRWDDVCRERTNIEAFNEMFGESVGNLDTENLTESMKSKWNQYEVMYLDQIPVNVLKSHWWWYDGFGRINND